MKKYRLKMVVANISHTSWWWNGKSFYEFDTINELLSFMASKMPMTQREINLIRWYDHKKKDGHISNTLWYEIKKGEDLMTEYTSF